MGSQIFLVARSHLENFIHYEEEKEQLFPDLYKKDITPLKGLKEFLDQMDELKIPRAIGNILRLEAILILFWMKLTCENISLSHSIEADVNEGNLILKFTLMRCEIANATLLNASFWKIHFQVWLRHVAAGCPVWE